MHDMNRLFSLLKMHFNQRHNVIESFTESIVILCAIHCHCRLWKSEANKGKDRKKNEIKFENVIKLSYLSFINFAIVPIDQIVECWKWIRLHAN